MLNPNSAFASGSYLGVRGRVLERLRSTTINDEVLKVVENGFEKALELENLVLSRVEKKLLLADVSKEVLDEISRRLDDT